MATKKFSQFTNAPTPTEETFFVGYNSATNLNTRTSKGNLLAQGVKNTSTDTLPFCMYGNTYLGAPVFGTGDQDKFVALAESATPSNYLTFQFIGGSINGVNIPLDNPLVGSSITLTPATVTFEDNGQGLVPNQYTDFINSIFEGFNLVSRIVTNNRDTIEPTPTNIGGIPYWNQINYCNADTYFLLFQETGSVPGESNMITNWGFKSFNGLGNSILLGNNNENLNNFQTMANTLSNFEFNQGVNRVSIQIP